MIKRTILSVAALGTLATASAPAVADHIPGRPCSNCASHAFWPTIHGKVKKAHHRGRTFHGTRRSDELLGHHGSDRLFGRGNDFIYGSHGRNVIYGGPGNDAISVHFGRGFVDCGPGRDIYHVAKSRKRGYKFRNCEKVDYRSESQRGRGLKPLP